jgi:hypothetical protein
MHCAHPLLVDGASQSAVRGLFHLNFYDTPYPSRYTPGARVIESPLPHTAQNPFLIESLIDCACTRFALIATSAVLATTASMTLTGNVPVDFPIADPKVFTHVDSKFPITFLGGPSGWNIIDIRYVYDKVTDTGYLGM